MTEKLRTLKNITVKMQDLTIGKVNKIKMEDGPEAMALKMELKYEAIKWINSLGCIKRKKLVKCDYEGDLEDSNSISEDLKEIIGKDSDGNWLMSGNSWHERGATLILMRFFNIKEEDLE